MSALFCDASAIIKRYASEAGSAWVISMIDPRACSRRSEHSFLEAGVRS